MFTRLGRMRNEDSVTQLTGKTDEDGKTGRSRQQERQSLTARNRGGDGRKGGGRMGKTIGRKQGEEDVKS